MDFCSEQIPEESFGFNYFVFPIIEGYYKCGEMTKGRALVDAFANSLDEELLYYQQFKGDKRKAIQQDMSIASQYYTMLMQMVQQYEIKAANQNQLDANDFFQRYQNAVGALGQI